jgi:heme/copper-type cytochrome/quinol oxidase subunit 1
MALTDTRPESGTVGTTSPGTEVTRPVNLLGTGDHKAIGVTYVVIALVFGVAGWIVTALAGAHEVGDKNFLSNDAARTLFTGGHVGLVLLVIIPLLLGLATYVVPLQVGANTVAFPRAASAALWAWLLSGGVFIVANAIDGGIGGGRAKANDLALLALLGLILAIVIATVTVMTTAVALRTPGLSLDRAPFFTWSTLVGGSIWLLTLPVLAANVILIYVDHRYGRPSDYGVAGTQWSEVSWLVSQPQIYAFMIPGLGIISDIVATLAGVRQSNRGLLYVGIGGFAILSVGAWAQPIFYPKVQDDAVFAAMALLIVLPVLLLLAAWATTLRSGKVSAKSPLLLALVSGVLLLLAVIAGALYVITPLKLRAPVGDVSVYSTGQYALVIAAVITAAVAGLMYWAPKMTGRFAADGLGKLNALVLLGGGLLAGLPLILLGFATRFDGLSGAADTLHGIAVAGSALLAIGVLLGLFALITTSHGPSVEADAWGTGQSLEWACPSPPPPGNFGELAVVRSPEPVLDAAESAEEA